MTARTSATMTASNPNPIRYTLYVYLYPRGRCSHQRLATSGLCERSRRRGMRSGMAQYEPLFHGDLLDDFYDVEDAPIDAELIFDAYSNDDFWLPPTRIKLEQCPLRANVTAEHLGGEIAPQASESTGTFEPDLEPASSLCFPSSQPTGGSATIWSAAENDFRFHAPQELPTGSDAPSVELPQVHLPVIQTMRSADHLLKSKVVHFHSMGAGPIAQFLQQGKSSTAAALQKAPMRDPSVKASRGRRRSKVKRSKAAKESPVPPLTAYNYYFRVERQRIINEGVNGTEANGELELGQHPFAWILHHLQEFMEKVLKDQWGRDPNAKRKHSKTHGRISFETLTARIAASWNTLPAELGNVFREISARDYERYAKERRNLIPKNDSCQSEWNALP